MSDSGVVCWGSENWKGITGCNGRDTGQQAGKTRNVDKHEKAGSRVGF